MKECNCNRGPEMGKKVIGCPPKVININHPAEPVLFHRVDVPAAMGDDITYPPENGLYKNVLLVYEANNHTYLYNSDGIPTNLSLDISELEEAVGDLQEGLENEIEERSETDLALREDIDEVAEDLEELKNSPDVVDIVATYADLEAYDTSDLGDKDVIRVLTDETHDNESSYYRWSTSTSTWTFIGATGPYYTKSETDTLLGGKLGTGTTFWGQTVNNGAVSGDIVLDDTTGMKIKFANGKLFIQNNTSVDIAVSGTNGMDNEVDFAMSTLASIQDGVSDTDAVNVRQLKKTVQIAPASDTPPTQSTVGKVGSLYTVVNSGVPEVYMCTAVSGSTYTWELTGPNAFTTNEWNALWA